MNRLVSTRLRLIVTVVVAVVAVVVVSLVSLGFVVRVAVSSAPAPSTATSPSPTVSARSARPDPGPTARSMNPYATTTPTAAPSSTSPPDPTETKPGPDTCQAAVDGLAQAITPTGPADQWRDRVAPLVTGDIEEVLPTVDTTAIPTGTPTVGDVIEQPGACDATLVWPETAWRIVLINQGSGWVASEWSAA